MIFTLNTSEYFHKCLVRNHLNKNGSVWYNYNDVDANLYSSAPKTIPYILLIRLKMFRISAMINKYWLPFVLVCIIYVARLALLTVMLSPSNLHKSMCFLYKLLKHYSISYFPLPFLFVTIIYLFIHSASLSNCSPTLPEKLFCNISNQWSIKNSRLPSAVNCLQLPLLCCSVVCFFFPVLFKSKSQETYTNGPQWLLLRPWVR